MIFLLSTIVCITSLSLIIKYSNEKKGNAVLLLASNYFTATLIGLIFFFTNKSATYSLAALALGAVQGGFFVYSFFAFAKAVEKSGTALSTTASRLSVFIPVLLSIIIYNETPKIFHYLGFALTAVTIYLFYLSLRADKSRKIGKMDYFYIFTLLISIGIGDFGMKVSQNILPATDKSFFVFSIFFFAFLYSTSVVIIKRIPVRKDTVISGGIMGIPNVFSSISLLGALGELSAIIVYPSANVGIIILTSVAAYLIWKEELSRLAKISIFTGIISIVLLNI